MKPDPSRKHFSARVRMTIGGFFLLALVSFSQAEPFPVAGRILHPAPAAGNEFGYAIAADGDFVAISSPYENIGSATSAGSVHIYRRNGAAGLDFHQTIPSPNLTPGAFFGFSIAMHNGILAVGSPRDSYDEDEENLVNHAGSIFLYSFDPESDQWLLSQKITAATREANVEFGRHVAIHNGQLVTGTRLIGSGLIGQTFMSGAGAAFLFLPEDGEWVLRAKIVSPDRGVNRRFGDVVAIHDGIIAIGEPGGNGSRGRVHIFEVEGPGPPPHGFTIDPPGLEPVDQYGLTLFLRDGLLLAGAPEHGYGAPGEPFRQSAGAAFFHRRNPDGTWSAAGKITAPLRQNNHRFGAHRVAFDGRPALVSSTAGAADGGLADLFGFDAASETWTPLHRIDILSVRENFPSEAGVGLTHTFSIKDGLIILGHRFNSNSDGNPTGAGAVFLIALPEDASGPEGFGAWADDNGLTGGDAEPLATPHDDGVANLLKYAFGMDGSGADVSRLVPGSGVFGLPHFGVAGSDSGPVFLVEYVRWKESDLTYTPKVSPDLTADSFVPMTGTETVTPIGDYRERVRVEQPLDTENFPRLFGVVEVTLGGD